MLKKILLLSSIISYTSLAVASCKVVGMEGNFPTQVCLDIKNLSNGIVGQDNQRLFYAAAGMGKRSVAQHYAQKANGQFVDCYAPELIHGYIKEGLSYYLKTFQDAIAQAEENNKKIAVLYIYDVDQINNTPEQLIALERLRTETAKCNAGDNKVKIFVIFSTHKNTEATTPTLNRLNGESIHIEFCNSETLRSIFWKHCCAPEVIESLKSEISSFHSQGLYLKDFAKETNEFHRLEASFFDLDRQLWENEDYHTVFYIVADHKKIKGKIVALGKQLCAASQELANKWEEKKERCVNDQEKMYCSSQQKLYAATTKSYLNRTCTYEMKDAMDDIFPQHWSNRWSSCNPRPEKAKFSNRTITNAAKNIMDAARDENNGIITEAILKRSANLPNHDKK